MISSAISAARSKDARSATPKLSARDTATAGSPHIEASMAAATVPEYRTATPTFAPGLIPDRTRSMGRSASSVTASFTQSAGVASRA